MIDGNQGRRKVGRRDGSDPRVRTSFLLVFLRPTARIKASDGMPRQLLRCNLLLFRDSFRCVDGGMVNVLVEDMF